MNFIKKGGNSVLGMQFRTCKNFWTSTDFSLVESPKIFTNTKATLQSLPLRFCESQNLGEKSLQKFLLLFAFAKSRIPLNFNSQSRVKSNKNNPCVSTTENSPASWCKKSDSRLQKCNRRFFVRSGESEALPLKAKKRSFLGTYFKKVGGSGAGSSALFAKESNKISGNGGKVAESSVDSAESQNLIKKINKKSLQKFLLLFAFAKSKIPLNPTNSNPPNKANSQNLVKNNSSLRDSAKQNRGKPYYQKTQNLQDRLPREQSSLAMTKNKDFAESRLDSTDSANSKHEANSSIADEFLGFCEASDKDKTKVYRGSEPKRSLKSRCESEFAPKFDKDDFYFLLVALASILLLIYLISGASVSYKEAVLLRENSTAIAKIANFSLAHFSQNLGLDFSAKLPNLIFHTLNLVLIYLISNKILKYKRDSVLCVGIYALIPGVIMQGGIINESIIVLFMVLVICYAELTKRLFIYPLCVLAVFLGESALMLFLALFFYFAITKRIKSALFALACLLANIYIYGIDISGAPKGNFLGVFSELALLYSPALFVYFIYVIYRNFAKGGANLLLYISGISIVTSVILSVRQDVDKEIYMFMSLCGIPLAIKQFLSGLRLRLPSFRNAYRRQFLAIAIILVFEAFLLIFSKQIYQFSNDENLFLNQFYIAKEVASALSARNISRVQIEGRMQERLAFYGIKEGGQRLRQVKRGGNIVVEYHGKVIARYAI